jgi:uncharacterized protein (UPF0248 family)
MYEIATEKGIEFNDKNKLSWDLSYSQGDYVGIHKAELAEAKLKEVCMSVLTEDEKQMFTFLTDKNYLYITHSIDYHHYYGQQIEVDLEAGYFSENELSEAIFDSFVDSVGGKIETAIKDYVSDIIAELKSYGYREIDYLYSDESAEEMIQANEYEFTEDGKFW